MLDFASDNTAGMHPSVLDALGRANTGRAPAYGADDLSQAVRARFREVFGPHAEAFLLWGGTAANVLALKAVLLPHQAVVCTEHAHLHADETGAPENIVGCKVIDLPAPDGKLRAEQIPTVLHLVGDPHRPQARVVSISQSTEYGTVYSLAEIRQIAERCRRHSLLLHMDGARLANACASLGVGFREMTEGVDILSFGATKNGLMGAEALVFLSPGLCPHFVALQKQAMQLASKMRFVAAQMMAYFENDLWLHNARHANAMARRLAIGIEGLPGLKFSAPVQANGLFVQLPAAAIAALKQVARFHVWAPALNEVRWLTAWDTPEADVDAFVAHVRRALQGAQ